MRKLLAIAFVLADITPALAETVVATRTIRARELIAASDLRVDPAIIPGTLSDPATAVGSEARYTIYAGRPVRQSDLSVAAVIQRNELVMLIYRNGALQIQTDARSLGRGAIGDRVRVMNLASRTTVTGTVIAPGQISVP